jgi:hypothetical protein
MWKKLKRRCVRWSVKQTKIEEESESSTCDDKCKKQNLITIDFENKKSTTTSN